MKLPPFPGDGPLFFTFNGWGRGWLDYLCGWPTHFGDPTILMLIVVVYMLIWDEEKVTKKILFIALSTFAAFALAHLLKQIFERPRPYAHYQQLIQAGGYKIHALFKLLLTESSFPSAHAATAFACAMALNCVYKNKLWYLYVFAAFVAFTRVYVGVHFPSDVLIGAAIGIACTYFFNRLFFKKLSVS